MARCRPTVIRSALCVLLACVGGCSGNGGTSGPPSGAGGDGATGGSGAASGGGPGTGAHGGGAGGAVNTGGSPAGGSQGRGGVQGVGGSTSSGGNGGSIGPGTGGTAGTAGAAGKPGTGGVGRGGHGRRRLRLRDIDVAEADRRERGLDGDRRRGEWRLVGRSGQHRTGCSGDGRLCRQQAGDSLRVDLGGHDQRVRQRPGRRQGERSLIGCPHRFVPQRHHQHRDSGQCHGARQPRIGRRGRECRQAHRR